jgi:hypothetical protein
MQGKAGDLAAGEGKATDHAAPSWDPKRSMNLFSKGYFAYKYIF